MGTRFHVQGLCFIQLQREKKGSNFHIKLLGQASDLTVFEKIGEMVDIYFAQKKHNFFGHSDLTITTDIAF